MKKVLLVVFVSFFAIGSFAEKISTESNSKAELGSTMVALSGNVIDELSGEALVGVEVKIEGADVKTYTDLDGHFVLDNLMQGSYKLVASYVSYSKNEKMLNVSNNSNQVKIELQPSK